MSEKKETLNEILFNATYGWAMQQWNRIFITVSMQNISNPYMQTLSRKDPVTGVDILVLNISPHACQIQSLPEGLFFSGRFGGKLEEFVLLWTDIHYLLNPDGETLPVSLYNIFASTPPEETAPVAEPAPEKPQSFLKLVD